jgi:hypothetical protein
MVYLFSSSFIHLDSCNKHSTGLQNRGVIRSIFMSHVIHIEIDHILFYIYRVNVKLFSVPCIGAKAVSTAMLNIIVFSFRYVIQSKLQRSSDLVTRSGQ